jgi:hypothetical protein
MTFTYASEEPERFLRAFNNLAVSKSGEADELKFESYFEELGPLPIEAVEEAARELKLIPGAFMPDLGTWFRLADDIAAKHLESSAQAQLPDSRHAEDNEIERIRIARATFVQNMEKMTGRTLADDHPMKVGTPRLPTFACTTCQDTGWIDREEDGVPRARHCQCWSHNPVLERNRAHLRAATTRRRVG